jgi:hypothetical protein
VHSKPNYMDLVIVGIAVPSAVTCVVTGLGTWAMGHGQRDMGHGTWPCDLASHR